LEQALIFLRNYIVSAATPTILFIFGIFVLKYIRSDYTKNEDIQNMMKGKKISEELKPFIRCS